MLNGLLAKFPSVEVGVRLLYWRVPAARRAGDVVRAQLARRRRTAKPASAPLPIDFDRVTAALREGGVRAGDVLVVHSSFGALKPTGLSPEEIIGRLLSLVGPEGTLAMPAIPIIAHEPSGDDKFNDAAYDRVFEYKPGSRRVQTGILPATMMAMSGAARSLHPGNSMVAIGPEAARMMEGNIAGDAPTPCGPTSSWAYCWRRGAKVAALGVDLVHSLTMIHVAEDCFEESWPVPDWYRRRRFRVVAEDGAFDLAVRERKHGWSQYYAERAFSRDLDAAGVSRSWNVDGLPVHCCESGALVDFLRSHPRPGYPYRFPLGLPGRRA